MASFDPQSIPNRFDFAAAQPRIYGQWEARGFFHAEPPAEGQPDHTKGPYCIVIPPPNVTGALHLGHALNNTLQDIQIRMHRMQGYNTLWMPGTDHAGIATQAVVEKRLREEEGKTRHDLGREGLVARIWEWKEVYEKRILDQLKQMGCSCDWARTRFTFDEGCSRAVRQTFFDLFSKGLIYRGKRLVNWDTFLQTAVSDDEVIQETVKGKFWHFRYPVFDPQRGEPTHVEIATTRPETMLGDTAVAVHPDPAGALDKAEAELRERLEKAPAKEKEALQTQIDNIQKRRTEMLPLLLKLRDMAAAGRKLLLPLLNREIPLITDEWAKPELGTGCVKITPAHDPNDYAVWQRHQEIGLINILNPDGTLNDSAGPYKGLTIPKARDRVVADLDKLGLVGDIEDRDIELPHSDRSKTPIEPYLADQWFVKMSDYEDGRPGLAQMAMHAVRGPRESTPPDELEPFISWKDAHIEAVAIRPPRYAKSYLDWLSEKRDWPVSRQLWWGHRIPVWSATIALGGVVNEDYMKREAKAVEEATEQIERYFAEAGIPRSEYALDAPTGYEMRVCVASDRATAAIEAFTTFKKSTATLSPLKDGEPAPPFMTEVPGFKAATIAAINAKRWYLIRQEEDVLDTWFSSALWPHSTLGWPEKTRALDYWYPTSVLITSRDIITLWVARMVLTGLNNMGEVPFREVFIHPKILDGYGETMSKSKGNGVDPIDIIDKFGADSLRFGLAALTTETQDVRMPVQFECPHCEALIDQTKKNRELPKIVCTKCNKEFSTQWARTDADKALPRAAVVSERFEVARNFMNKLWNASRFVLINLADGGVQSSKFKVQGSPASNFEPGTLNLELTTEDRWLLSRLATVTSEATDALKQYRYADAAKLLYDFAWDEFCSFYVEIAKARLADDKSKATAQRILAHALDTLLRLLHPMMPFLTEEVWQLLNQVAPNRQLVGWDELAEQAKSHAESARNPRRSSAAEAASTHPTEFLIKAPWPTADLRWQDKQTEARFSVFQQALGAIREIRSRQNIATREELEFCIKCDVATAELLKPMTAYFQSMTNATATGFGTNVTIPPTHAKSALAGLEIYVDLKDFIDVKAELAKNEQQEQKLLGLIKTKEGKLANEGFVSRAPANVVQSERDSLAQLQEQLTSVRAALAALKK